MSNNPINIAYLVEDNEFNYNFNIVNTGKTIPLGNIQIPIYNSTENPIFHVYHVLVDGLKYTKV